MASQHCRRCHGISWWIGCCCSGLLALGGITSAVATPYTIVDLGPNTSAGAISERGQVTGNVLEGGFRAVEAFVYDSAGLHLLGTVAGIESFAGAINTFGEMVGAWSTPDGAVHAFLHTGNAPLQSADELPALAGFERNSASDLNDAGVVVGTAYHSNIGGSRAVKWEQGNVVDLGLLAGGDTASATSINAAGLIAGYSTSATTNQHATVFDAVGVHDLGVLAGGGVSFAYALNNRGQVVGYSEYDNDLHISHLGHAFLWQNGLMSDLEIGVDSAALGINSSSQIVGTASFSITSSTYRAFLWQDGTAVDLNSLINETGWLLTNATAINDLGQIVGGGIYQGQAHGFILTPTVAEPSTLPLAVAALLSLVGIARWRRHKRRRAVSP